MGNVVRYGNKYRCCEHGVPAYAEALGVRHLGEMIYIREIDGRLVFMPPNRKMPPADVKAAPPTQQSTLMNGLFTPVAKQAEMLMSWGQYCNWLGTSPSSYAEVVHDARESASRIVWPRDRLTAVVLVPYLPSGGGLPSHLNTISFFLGRIDQILSNAGIKLSRGPFASLTVDTIRLVDYTMKNTPKPGIRVEVIDFGAFSERDSWWRPTVSPPNAGILAAAALHPNWLLKTDGIQAPTVVLAGYELNKPHSGSVPWGAVPCISRQLPNTVNIFARDFRILPIKDGSKWAMPMHRGA